MTDVASRATAAPLSLQEWLALPETNRPCEVVDGLVVMTPSPTGPHQRVVFRLGRLLDGACPAGYEVLPSPLDWVLWEAPRLRVRQPDLVVVTHAQAEDTPLSDAPLLAVEVVSPGSFERDVVTKRAEYARAGLAHYWVVTTPDPIAGGPEDVEVVGYRAVDGVLEPYARASGRERFAVTEPFVIAFTPADLAAR